ncbi:MAG TPA: hypothetical protein VF789_09125 [Thermoanaerobaculia bacterium]
MKPGFLTCGLLLGLAVVLAASPGFAMPPGGNIGQDLLEEMKAVGWKPVAPGVLQRSLGDHKVETMALGPEGFAWMAEQLQDRLELLLDEYRVRPTANLRQAIRNQQRQIRTLREQIQTLPLEPADPAKSSCNETYLAVVNAYGTAPNPGVRADVNASFSKGCGYSGDTYAYAYATATLNGTTTTVAQTDPDSGANISSHATASVAGTTDCYSYAYALVNSSALGISHSMVEENFECQPPVGESYFAVTPCRVLDTRNTTILTNAQPRVVNIAGLCGIPSTAKAVAFNVAAVSPTGSGKFRLYPGDASTANPNALLSILTFAPATSPRANSGVIQLAANGAGTLGIYPEVAGSPGQAHLVLDVQGYFSKDASPAAGAVGPLGFQTVPPCRMAWPASPLVAGTATNFTAQGVCGVPAGAAVASLHLGVARPAYNGYISLYPSNIATPGTSTLNFTSGITMLRNGAWVKLSPATPDIAAYFGSTAGATASVHFDVNGYFKSDAPLKYNPITPCRAVQGVLLTTDTVRTFPIQGTCGVPVGAKAVFVRLQIANPTSSGDLTAYPSNLALSEVAVSTAKFDAGEPTLSMGTVVPLSTLANDLAVSPGEMTAGGTVALAVDVFGYFQ